MTCHHNVNNELIFDDGTVLDHYALDGPLASKKETGDALEMPSNVITLPTSN